MPGVIIGLALIYIVLLGLVSLGALVAESMSDERPLETFIWIVLAVLYVAAITIVIVGTSTNVQGSEYVQKYESSSATRSISFVGTLYCQPIE